MKPKKSKKANLERFRTIFFQIGTVLTLAAILVAFEWNSTVKLKEIEHDYISWDDSEVLPPVTKPKPEIKEVKPPSFNFEIVDNNKEIDIEDDLQKILADLENFDPYDYVDFGRREDAVDDDPVLIAQIMPTFQGKDINSFRDYIAKNLKFPERAKNTGISGTVYASFVVDKTGKISSVKILRGVHPDIDNEVIKVIRNSPKWEPGFNNGRYVNVQFSIPVSFKLM